MEQWSMQQNNEINAVRDARNVYIYCRRCTLSCFIVLTQLVKLDVKKKE